jgi:hypothetical protein
MHVSLERIGPWPFRAEAVPFLIAVPTVARVTHMVLGMRPLPPPVSMMACRRLEVSTLMWSFAG